MSNRAAQLRAENAGKPVKRRGRSFIEFDIGQGVTRHITTIEPLHDAEGVEIDMTWVAATSPWSYKDAHADYTSQIKAAFNGAPLVRFSKTVGAVDAWVTLQPQQLNWSNDVNSVQMISAVQNVPVTLTDDLAHWPNAYGAGRHFEYQNHPKRLIKRLILDSKPPAPSASIIAGGNPVLQVQFLFNWSGSQVYIDGAQWNASTTRTTAGSIEFRVGGETVYRFDSPYATDSGTEPDTIPGLMRVRKAGSNLYVEVRIPWAWLDTAVYPVEVDPTLTLQPDAAAGQDTQIDPGGTNAGILNVMAIGRWGAENYNYNRSLIKFDLSALPATATIVATTLSLTPIADYATAAGTWGVYRQKRAWVEGNKANTYDSPASGATWIRYDTTNQWSAAGGFHADDCEQTDIGTEAFTASETLNAARDITLTPTTKAALDLGNGWMLKVVNEADINCYTVATSDHATATYRPLLTIEYTLGGVVAPRYHQFRR